MGFEGGFGAEFLRRKQVGGMIKIFFIPDGDYMLF